MLGYWYNFNPLHFLNLLYIQLYIYIYTRFYMVIKKNKNIFIRVLSPSDLYIGLCHLSLKF